MLKAVMDSYNLIRGFLWDRYDKQIHHSKNANRGYRDADRVYGVAGDSQCTYLFL